MRNRTFILFLLGSFFIIGWLLVGGFLGLMIGVTIVFLVLGFWYAAK